MHVQQEEQLQEGDARQTGQAEHLTMQNAQCKTRRTRLTYNCAHLRSTKESLMFEYFAIYFFKERYDKIIFNFKSHLKQVFSTKHYNIYIFGLTHFADFSLIRNLFIIPRKDNMIYL